MKSNRKLILSTKIPIDWILKKHKSNKSKFILGLLLILSLCNSFTVLSHDIKNESIVTLGIETDTLKTRCKTRLYKVKFDSISKGSSFDEYEQALFFLT